MTIRFSVYRGPGNRIVAISKEPVHEHWLIKAGEEGKKLRVTKVPESIHKSFRSVCKEHVGDSYQLSFTGAIDAFGRCIDAIAPIIYWEAQDVDVDHARQSLRDWVAQLAAFGADLSFQDDMSGTRVTIDSNTFGIVRSPRPGCIDYSGNGAGSFPLDGPADLICLIALLAGPHEGLRLADSDGNTLSRRKVFRSCSNRLTPPFEELLQEQGFTSINTMLRTLNVRQIRF